MTLRTRPGLGAFFREVLAEKCKPPQIALATKIDRAIDLSCRACGAGAWALGLDSRLGTPASLPFSTPNLQLILRVVAELGILRVVAELQNS